jgi:hypothetical protein
MQHLAVLQASLNNCGRIYGFIMNFWEWSFMSITEEGVVTISETYSIQNNAGRIQIFFNGFFKSLKANSPEFSKWLPRQPPKLAGANNSTKICPEAEIRTAREFISE